MTEFIDNFEATRSEVIEITKSLIFQELNEMRRIENNIVQLLEASSRIIMQNNELPTLDDFMNMQKELAAKVKYYIKAFLICRMINWEWQRPLLLDYSRNMSKELRSLRTLKQLSRS